MKYLKVLAIALLSVGILVSCEKKQEEVVKVATFEEVSLGADTINSYTDAGVYNWISGDFGFTTGMTTSDYGKYYYNYVVSGQQSNVYKDFSDQYHSAPGGAVAGRNFVVAYQEDPSYLSKGSSLNITYSGFATYLPGTYITNTAYAATVIKEGNGFARAFKDGDYFKLTLTGYLAGVKCGSVEFYLADFRNGKSLIVKEWSYLELTGLGIVDEIRCKLESTDVTNNSMNTPAYFCLDNFGAKK